MTSALILTVIVILAVAWLATRPGHEPDVLSEREAADRLRPYSGAVESAPQSAPIEEARNLAD